MGHCRRRCSLRQWCHGALQSADGLLEVLNSAYQVRLRNRLFGDDSRSAVDIELQKTQRLELFAEYGTCEQDPSTLGLLRAVGGWLRYGKSRLEGRPLPLPWPSHQRRAI
jgi:hypothetical protein